jgi:diguanylate cyclase (GGDEF)-like protein/PAS domain S-box-containing protein
MSRIRQSSINAVVIVFLSASLPLLLLGSYTIKRCMEELKAAADEERKSFVMRSSMNDSSDFLTDQACAFATTYEKASLSAFCAAATEVAARNAAIAATTMKWESGEERQALEKAEMAAGEITASELRSVKLAAEAVGMAKSELPPIAAAFELSPSDEALGKSGKLERARELVFGAEHWEAKRRAEKAADEFLGLAQKRAEERIKVVRDEADRALLLVMVVYLFVFLTGLAIMALVYWLTVLPVRHYIQTLSASDLGNVYPELKPVGSAELVELARVINLRRAQRLRAERAFNDTELRLKTNLFMMPLGALETDGDNKVLSWNPAAEKIFGFTAEEVLGRDLLSLIVPERLRDEVGEVIAQLNRGIVVDKHINANLRKDGSEIVCEWYNTPLEDSTGAFLGWASIIKDITEERAEADKLLYLSRHDPLTGLLNRRSLQEKLDEETLRNKRSRGSFATIMLDIDKFKRFNDQHGHEYGDEVLKSVARVMTATVRATDSVGRWGGEEFLILLPETDLAGGIELAEKIRVRIEESNFPYKDSELKLTVTAGVAVCLDPEESVDNCIRRADEALLSGKARGRNRVEGS